MNNIRSTYSRISINLAELLFLLFFALKPYYLKPSGSIGAVPIEVDVTENAARYMRTKGEKMGHIFTHLY